MQTLEEGGTDVPGVLTLDYQGSVVQHNASGRECLPVDLKDLRPGLAGSGMSSSRAPTR